MSMASLQGLPEEQAEAVLDEMSVKMDEHLQETEEKIQAAINQALDSKPGALVSAMGGDASKLNGGSNGGNNGVHDAPSAGPADVPPRYREYRSRRYRGYERTVPDGAAWGARGGEKRNPMFFSFSPYVFLT